jgi:hypothetical protein
MTWHPPVRRVIWYSHVETGKPAALTAKAKRLPGSAASTVQIVLHFHPRAPVVPAKRRSYGAGFTSEPLTSSRLRATLAHSGHVSDQLVQLVRITGDVPPDLNCGHENTHLTFDVIETVAGRVGQCARPCPGSVVRPTLRVVALFSARGFCRHLTYNGQRLEVAELVAGRWPRWWAAGFRRTRRPWIR